MTMRRFMAVSFVVFCLQNRAGRTRQVDQLSDAFREIDSADV